MKLDFRALEQPSMEIALLDDEVTTIHVTTPTQGDLKRLESLQKSIVALAKKTDSGAVGKVYDFIADLMSRNKENMKITGKDLSEKYRLGLSHLFAFVQAYNEFIAEIKSAKNF